MLADIMTTALAKDRHVRLYRMVGLGDEIRNTTPSSFEVLSELATSGSLELRYY